VLIKDLIHRLQELEEKEKQVWGEDSEIMIDSFTCENHSWRYTGFSNDIKITYSADGVYPILTAIFD
jgi:hypothetical protein